MSNFHRLAWIDARIRDGLYPNSRTIAERFEISPRQAQRDIEYLKYSMGAPLEFSALKKGYFYSDATFALPSEYITGEDRKVFTYLAHQYRMTGGNDIARLADLFSRLGGADGGSEEIRSGIPIFRVEADEVDSFNTLARAVRSQCKVEMTYRNSNGENSGRVFHPYKLFRREQINYTVGFCELRNEIRTFRLSRIKSLRILEGSFTISALYNEKAYEGGAGFNYREPYTAEVEFGDVPDSGILNFDLQPVGEKHYSLRFYSSDKLLLALLSQPSAFSIRSPQWLKQRLKERLDKIYSTNFENDIICRT